MTKRLTSLLALLTVALSFALPTLKAAPDTTVPSGKTVALSVTFTPGNPVAVTIQWTKDGVNLVGATQATLSVTPFSSISQGVYTVTVSNVAGSTSDSVKLTLAAVVPPPPVNVAPVIVTQPTSQIFTVGAPVTLSVSASGTAPLSYQWTRNGVNIPGATSPSNSVAAATASLAGSYTVTVTNVAGSVTSSVAVLSLAAPQSPPTGATIKVVVGS